MKFKPFLILGLLAAIIFFADAAWAQSINIDLGADKTADGTLSGRVIQLILLITVLALAPSILVMITSFTRIIVVLSIVRQALATPNIPPNAVLISLALFMTGFIMAPTFEKAWNSGIEPIIEEKVELKAGLEQAIKPFQEFMLKNVREKDLELFMGLTKAPKVEKPEDVSLAALIPSFMISELKRAFEIGFLIFVPFLIIDMVVASVLMSMGMMMLPPSMISMPFKLIFFVLIDGWYLLTGSLLRSFVT